MRSVTFTKAQQRRKAEQHQLASAEALAALMRHYSARIKASLHGVKHGSAPRVGKGEHQQLPRTR